MAATDFVTETQVDSLAAAVAAAVNAVDALADGNTGDIGTLASLDTTAKANLVVAINEVKTIADAAAGGGVSINDAATNLTQAWSSQKITDELNAVLDGAPAALDTLNELAAALGDDANFAATVNTALGNRLRVDTAAQGLTGTQQTNGKTNLGIASSSADFAAAFNAALT